MKNEMKNLALYLSPLLATLAWDVPTVQAQSLPLRGQRTIVGTYGVGGLVDLQLAPGRSDSYGVGAFAQVQVRGVVQGQRNMPLIWGQASARGNMAGGGTYDFFTGLSADGRFMIGGQLLDAGSNGCMPYFGAQVYGSADIGFRTHRTGGEIRVTPETGLMCAVDGTLFTITPTTGTGYTGYRFPGFGNAGNYEMARSFAVYTGGTGRLMVDERFFLTLEALYTPRVTEDFRDSSSFQFLANVAYRLTPEVMLELAAEVRNFGGAYIQSDSGDTFAGQRTDITSYLIVGGAF